MGIDKIKKEMQLFQVSLKKLSSSMSGTSSLWKDEKFSELFSSVNEVAGQSKNVMVTANKCCDSMAKFEKIASEKY